MNIFEGARRVAILIAGFIVIGGAIAIYNIAPHVVINYKVLNFGIAPLKIDACNELVDAKRYNSHVTPNGREFSIRTCFKSSRADDGRLLIPYAEAPNNMIYMNSEYSNEVRAYTEAVANAITPTADDFKEADAEYTRQVWTKRFEGLSWLIGGLLAYWLGVRIVGWIVRGFMGIPSGQDYRVRAVDTLEA
jgi:hypothetical protein